MKDKIPESELAIDDYIMLEQAGKLKIIKKHLKILGSRKSAGKKKSVQTSKAGCYIKPLLVQCDNSAVKSENHPEIRNRYPCLRKCHGRNKAIIAVAGMLLTALYNC